MERQVILAVRIPPVDRVPALRSPPVSLALLVPGRLASQRYAVRLYHGLAGKKQHLAPALMDHYPVDREDSAASAHDSSLPGFQPYVRLFPKKESPMIR